MEEKAQEIKSKVSRISLRLILILLLFLSVFGILYYITDEIVLENENAFDTAIFQLLDFEHAPRLRSTMLFFTFFGSSNFLFPAYLLLSGYFFFKSESKWRSLNIAAVGLSSAGLLHLLKFIFKRHRPAEQMLKNVAGYSYPSGHSFSSFTFSGLLIYLIWQSHISKTFKWLFSILLFGFACMVALSRVYFHVHYPSDVIAGLMLSIIWLGICYLVLIYWKLPEKVSSKEENHR